MKNHNIHRLFSFFILFLSLKYCNSAFNSTSCMVDQCLDCDNNATNTCNLCRKGFYLIEFYGAEKRFFYQDCWSFKKLAWVIFLSILGILATSGLCYLFYKLGRSTALQRSLEMKNEAKKRNKTNKEIQDMKEENIYEKDDENNIGTNTTRKVIRREASFGENYISNLPTQRQQQRNINELNQNSINSVSSRRVFRGQNTLHNHSSAMKPRRIHTPRNLTRTASKKSFRSIQSRNTLHPLQSPSNESPLPFSPPPGIILLDQPPSTHQFSLGNENVFHNNNQQSHEMNLPREIREVIEQRQGQSRRTLVVRADGSKAMLGAE